MTDPSDRIYCYSCRYFTNPDECRKGSWKDDPRYGMTYPTTSALEKNAKFNCAEYTVFVSRNDQQEGLRKLRQLSNLSGTEVGVFVVMGLGLLTVFAYLTAKGMGWI